VVAKKIPNTWYVSIYVPREDTSGHYSRRSRTFTSEDDAKQFARTRLAEGVEVSAGTLNPVRPKRIIGPLQIERWLTEQDAAGSANVPHQGP
jgi:hypothetical protein